MKKRFVIILVAIFIATTISEGKTLLFWNGTPESIVSPGETTGMPTLGTGGVQPPSQGTKLSVWFGHTTPTGVWFNWGFILPPASHPSGSLGSSIHTLENEGPAAELSNLRPDMTFTKSVKVVGEPRFALHRPERRSGVYIIRSLRWSEALVVEAAIDWLQVEGSTLTGDSEYVFGSIRVNSDVPVDYSGRWVGDFRPIRSTEPIRLINQSVRLDGMIPGQQVILGSVNEGRGWVLVRAIGPGLARFGVPNPCQNPTLSVFNSIGGVEQTNQGWDSSIGVQSLGTTRDNLVRAMAASGAFALQAGSKDAALLVERSAGGAFTVGVTAGPNGGAILMEMYTVPDGVIKKGSIP